MSAELARLILRTGDLASSLGTAGLRLAAVLGLPAAEITLEAKGPDDHWASFALTDTSSSIGTPRIVATAGRAQLRRVRRVIPSLEA